MDLLNEDLDIEGELKDKTIMADPSSVHNGRKRGLLLIDINYEKMQVHMHIVVLLVINV